MPRGQHSPGYSSTYYLANREVILEASKKWYQAHPERRRELKRIRYVRLLNEVFNKLGHVCKHCGFTDKRALQIDHVYGSSDPRYGLLKTGRKVRPSREQLLRLVLRDVEGLYQILCANCNWIKRDVDGEVKMRLTI